MGRLIDADELYAAFRRDIMGGLNYDRILREAKPVDAVPVVRCKDCKWFRRYIDTDTEFCDLTECTTFGADFCSRGERKDGDNG